MPVRTVGFTRGDGGATDRMLHGVEYQSMVFIVKTCFTVQCSSSVKIIKM